MRPSLSGPLAKVGRAEEHLTAFNQAIDGWGPEDRTSLSSDKHANGLEYSFYAEFDPLPDVERWALFVGDCVHNLRSALDQTVYECSGPMPPSGCEFPIFTDPKYLTLPDKDRNGYLYKVRGVGNVNVRALIEGAQPWQDGDRANAHPLWVIHELNNQDKHRLLTPVAVYPHGGEVGISIDYWEMGQHPPIDISWPETVPFEPHAEVLTVHLGEPTKRVEVKLGYAFFIALLVGDQARPAQTSLRKACEYTRGLIEQIRDALV